MECMYVCMMWWASKSKTTRRLAAGVEERAEWVVPDHSVQPRQLISSKRSHPPVMTVTKH